MAQTFIALFYGRAYRDSLTTGLDADLLKWKSRACLTPEGKRR